MVATVYKCKNVKNKQNDDPWYSDCCLAMGSTELTKIGTHENDSVAVSDDIPSHKPR